MIWVGKHSAVRGARARSPAALRPGALPRCSRGATRLQSPPQTQFVVCSDSVPPPIAFCFVPPSALGSAQGGTAGSAAGHVGAAAALARRPPASHSSHGIALSMVTVSPPPHVTSDYESVALRAEAGVGGAAAVSVARSDALSAAPWQELPLNPQLTGLRDAPTTICRPQLVFVEADRASSRGGLAGWLRRPRPRRHHVQGQEEQDS